MNIKQQRKENELIWEAHSRVFIEEGMFSPAYLKQSDLMEKLIRAAYSEDIDKFEDSLSQLGHKVDPRFINDQIEKIKNILNGPGFDSATQYVREWLGLSDDYQM